MENSFIAKINEIYEKLGSIVTAGELFNTEVVSSLNELKDLNISLIIEDFKKGNYLGNRKIDIDLSLNNSSTTESATYKQADVILVDGTKLEMPFDNGSGGILELSSHADIKNYIVNHALYTANVVDTEIVVYESFADTPIMIRVRDADGKASNIERIELHSYSGAVVNTKVSYFWAKTTSALETLANRVGDIIQLGNDIDSIVTLSQRIEELISLQSEISKIIDVHTNLAEIIENSDNMNAIKDNSTNKVALLALHGKITELTNINTNLTAILASQNYAQIATDKAVIATEKAQTATDKATIATDKAVIATEKAQTATDKVALIQSISVQGQTLTAGQSATVSYNSVTNKFTFGIPKGDKGDIGEAFKVNSIGTLAQRALYDNELANFSFLASDVEVDGSIIPHIYFKKSSTSADWTTGIPFGRGEKGDTGVGIGIVSISRTSGTGLAGSTDIYTITLSDDATHEFSVYNGTDSDIDSSDLTALSDALNQSIGANSTAINDHKNSTQNPHNVTAEQVCAYTKDESDDMFDEKANAIDVYTKTELDLKISYKQFDKPSSAVLFIKATASSIKIPAGLKLTVNTTSFKVASDYTLTLSSNLVGSIKTAGTDYYVYAKEDGSFYISASDSITTDRLIGGFHYGLVGETELPTGNKTEADMVKIRGINEYSFWDLKYRPVASPKGMVNIGKKWYDIYLLNSEHITNGTSKAGATIAAGTTEYGRAIPKIPLEFGGNNTLTYGKFTWFQASEIAKAASKQLLNYSEFPTIAYGVTEQVSSLTNTYETVMGKVEHYPNLTSKYGIEQATGTQWIWGNDLANGYGSTDFAWKTGLTDSRGNIYSTNNSPVAVLLGGGRGDGVNAGSRASSWLDYVWYSDWNIGCRFACDHLELV